MRRRSFLAGAATLGALPLLTPDVGRSAAARNAKLPVTPALEAQTRGVNMKITAAELWQITGDARQYGDYLEEENPKVGLLAPSRAPTAPTRTYLKISTDAGFEGFNGPHDQRTVNEITKTGYSLANLIGQDPLAIDSVWESLVTGDNRYTGMYMFRVAAITNALWDLKGRFCGLPVYRLLGGSRKVVDCYATTLGMPTNTLEELAEGAARVKKAGFKGQKWFPTLGPREGAAGLEFNINLMRTLREVLGTTDEIIIDALTRWDLSYSMAWCKAAEQYRPRWLEEPVQTYLQTEPLTRLRQMTTIPIATGEHNYNRWDYHELMKAGAVDIINPDVEWIGISEVTKICAMASAWGLRVAPHHQTVHALAHLVASQPFSVCPLFESKINSMVETNFFHQYPIKYNDNSQIVLTDRPGLGIELEESRITSRKMIWAQT
jgi:L-rhamnonate dehydratase